MKLETKWFLLFVVLGAIYGVSLIFAIAQRQDALVLGTLAASLVLSIFGAAHSSRGLLKTQGTAAPAPS